MLSSIHPLGERSKGHRWVMTVVQFTVASVAGGALMGSAASLVGAVIKSVGAGASARLVTLTVLAAGAAYIDLRGWPRWLWRPHRQVNENWLVAYRRWVYAGGFGVQLGAGLLTIVTSAALYVVLATSIAMAAPAIGALLGGLFGLGRGLSLLFGHSIDDPEALRRFHQRFAARERSASIASAAGCGLVAVSAGVLVLSGAGL